jgi:L-ascorbate metabolism protein UlaG (beta-lactamase superfamily)
MSASFSADETRDRVVPSGHATVLVDLAGVRFLTDPVIRKRVAFLERVVPLPAVPSDIDAILLSHLHHDHCDLPSLRTLLARSGRPTVVVVPVGSGAFLRRALRSDVVELAIGEQMQVGPVTVTATPAVHNGRRGRYGTRAEAIGFLLTAGPGRTIYFAGDTDLFPEMSQLAPAVDVALLPIWGWGPRLGWGHLDPVRAAEATARLAPSCVVPIHHGTFLPIGLRALPVGVRTLTRPAADFSEAVSRRHLDVAVSTQPWGEEVRWAHQQA